MIKEVLANVDPFWCAEASLLIFLMVFIAIAIRTLLGETTAAQKHAAIVFSDVPTEMNDE